MRLTQDEPVLLAIWWSTRRPRHIHLALATASSKIGKILIQPRQDCSYYSESHQAFKAKFSSKSRLNPLRIWCRRGFSICFFVGYAILTVRQSMHRPFCPIFWSMPTRSSRYRKKSMPMASTKLNRTTDDTIVFSIIRQVAWCACFCNRVLSLPRTAQFSFKKCSSLDKALSMHTKNWRTVSVESLEHQVVSQFDANGSPICRVHWGFLISPEQCDCPVFEILLSSPSKFLESS